VSLNESKYMYGVRRGERDKATKKSEANNLFEGETDKSKRI